MAFGWAHVRLARDRFGDTRGVLEARIPPQLTKGGLKASPTTAKSGKLDALPGVISRKECVTPFS